MSGNDDYADLDYKMLKTRRNKDKILYNGFFYVKDYQSKIDQYWRCETRKCKGRLATTPGDKISKITEISSHNHVVAEEDIKSANFSGIIKKLAETTQYSTSKVFSVATTSENINLLPIIKKQNVYKNIRSIRKRNHISIMTNDDLSRSNIFTNRGVEFCFHDSGSQSPSRIVIFTTQNNLLHLKNSCVWIVDGTFKVVPKEFYQLYIIHGKILGRIFPLIYILMANKTQADYETLLNILNTKLHVDFPDHIIMDFEIASFNAFKKASKTSNIYFCLFHLGQCLWRKIQKLGMTKLFHDDPDFRLFIKCFSSLAFVPPHKVSDEFQKLKSKSLTFDCDNLQTFVNYFEKNFVLSTKYHIQCWNAYGRVKYAIEMTTNAAELFHLHFYARFEQSHSGLDTFILKLKETQSLVEQDINYILCNPLTKKTKYTLKMEKIKNICEHYDQYTSIFFWNLYRKYTIGNMTEY